MSSAEVKSPRLSHYQGVHRPLVPLNERFKCVLIARQDLPDKYAVCSDHKFPAFRDRPGFIARAFCISSGSYHNSGAGGRSLKKYPFDVGSCSVISGSTRHNGKLAEPLLSWIDHGGHTAGGASLIANPRYDLGGFLGFK